MTKKEQRINRLFLYAGILTLIYYLGQGITVRFGQSLLYLWLMLSAVCFGRFFLWKWAWKHGKSAPIPRPPRASIWRKTRIRYASPPAGRARTSR